MAEDNHNEHENEDKITVIVNGREKTVSKRELSFEEVVRLAFDTPPSDNVIFTVAYRNADQNPDHGTLVAGQKVKVKKHGTIFNVTATNKS